MECNPSLKPVDISSKLKEGFEKVRRNLIEKEKKNNGYLILSDKKGNIKNISARDL